MAYGTESTLFKTDAFIAGRWLPSALRYSVCDPSTGQPIAEVTRSTAELAREAIGAAQTSFEVYRSWTGAKRKNLLKRLLEQVLEHREELAALVTLESGKPIVEAEAEIAYAASYFEWFSAEAPRLYGCTIPAHSEALRIRVQREPVGVCAAITPWNFPLAMIARKLGAALAAGCPMVIKPAEATPLSALALGELTQRAEFPPGLVSVLPGDRSDAAVLGELLCSDLRVRKISFTGSTRVGKQLFAQCASQLKRLSLELGGNAPFIIFEDANLERAVAGAIACKFRNSGQTCVSANRFLVHSSVADEFTTRFTHEAAGLQLGKGSDRKTQIGPLINEAALEKVERHVADALSRGARLLSGGQRTEPGSRFYVPTVLDRVETGSLIWQEETFGPVAAITRFHTEREALDMANATQAGLASYFYTEDRNRAWRVSEALQYGMVGCNTGLLSTAAAPFGGVKESGQGREGSRYGMDDYLDYKYLCEEVETRSH